MCVVSEYTSNTRLRSWNMKRAYPYTGSNGQAAAPQAQGSMTGPVDYSQYGYGGQATNAQPSISAEEQQAQWHKQWQQYYAQQAAAAAAGTSAQSPAMSPAPPQQPAGSQYPQPYAQSHPAVPAGPPSHAGGYYQGSQYPQQQQPQQQQQPYSAGAPYAPYASPQPGHAQGHPPIHQTAAVQPHAPMHAQPFGAPIVAPPPAKRPRFDAPGQVAGYSPPPMQAGHYPQQPVHTMTMSQGGGTSFGWPGATGAGTGASNSVRPPSQAPLGPQGIRGGRGGASFNNSIPARPSNAGPLGMTGRGGARRGSAAGANFGSTARGGMSASNAAPMASPSRNLSGFGGLPTGPSRGGLGGSGQARGAGTGSRHASGSSNGARAGFSSQNTIPTGNKNRYNQNQSQAAQFAASKIPSGPSSSIPAKPGQRNATPALPSRSKAPLSTAVRASSVADQPVSSASRKTFSDFDLTRIDISAIGWHWDAEEHRQRDAAAAAAAASQEADAAAKAKEETEQDDEDEDAAVSDQDGDAENDEEDKQSEENEPSTSHDGGDQAIPAEGPPKGPAAQRQLPEQPRTRQNKRQNRKKDGSGSPGRLRICFAVIPAQPPPGAPKGPSAERRSGQQESQHRHVSTSDKVDVPPSGKPEPASMDQTPKALDTNSDEVTVKQENVQATEPEATVEISGKLEPVVEATAPSVVEQSAAQKEADVETERAASLAGDVTMAPAASVHALTSGATGGHAAGVESSVADAAETASLDPATVSAPGADESSADNLQTPEVDRPRGDEAGLDASIGAITHSGDAAEPPADEIASQNEEPVLPNGSSATGTLAAASSQKEEEEETARGSVEEADSYPTSSPTSSWSPFSVNPPQSALNRISISYAEGRRRIMIDADVIKAVRIFRGAGRIEIDVKVTTVDGTRDIAAEGQTQWQACRGVLVEQRDRDDHGFAAVSPAEMCVTWGRESDEALELPADPHAVDAALSDPSLGEREQDGVKPSDSISGEGMPQIRAMLPPLHLLQQGSGAVDADHDTVITVNVTLDKRSTAPEAKWLKTGDLEEWLAALPGFLSQLNDHAWQQKIRVEDPDPAPTMQDVFADWSSKSFIGPAKDRRRFIVDYLRTSAGQVEILCRLVRGERAAGNMSSKELASPDSPLAAAAKRTAFSSHHTHLSLAVMALFGLAEEYAARAGATPPLKVESEGTGQSTNESPAKRPKVEASADTARQSEFDAKINDLLMSMPQNLVFRALDGMWKEISDKNQREKQQNRSGNQNQNQNQNQRNKRNRGGGGGGNGADDGRSKRDGSVASSVAGSSKAQTSPAQNNSQNHGQSKKRRRSAAGSSGGDNNAGNADQVAGKASQSTGAAEGQSSDATKAVSQTETNEAGSKKEGEGVGGATDAEV
ncbi:unnamed protein product [Parajaminaea phylloscopi]